MALSLLSQLNGAVIDRVRRVHYVYKGKIDQDFGPVELSAGGATLLFDNGSDGESLRVEQGAWRDPFAEPLSDENRQFVLRSGKWTAFDVSTSEPWADLIGDRFVDFVPVSEIVGKTTGIELRTARGGVIRLSVMADELFVDSVSTRT